VGANVDPRRKNGQTPLHEAAELNQAELDVAEAPPRPAEALSLEQVSHRL